MVVEVRVSDIALALTKVAMPKSSNFTPEAATMTLLGFTSRWTTPIACTAASPEAMPVA